MKSPQSKTPQSKTPLWETLVIAGSFVGMWIYFLAWIAAGRAKLPLSPYWQFLLVPCLVALFIVFKRRLARARITVQEQREQSMFPQFGSPAKTKDIPRQNGNGD